MKKLLIALTLLCVWSCDPYHKAVKTYLKKNLDDFKSYESMEWTRYGYGNGRDSVFMSYLSNDKPDIHVGFSQWHKYRAKNRLGGYEIHEEYFLIYKTNSGQLQVMGLDDYFRTQALIHGSNSIFSSRSNISLSHLIFAHYFDKYDLAKLEQSNIYFGGIIRNRSKSESQ